MAIGGAYSIDKYYRLANHLPWFESEQPSDAIKSSVKAAEQYGLGYNLVAGANIAGFQRVAEAMMAQGIF